MIQSRCGVCCKECEYKECKGCVSISKPFWGEACPVKQCCEKKKHENCGQCTEFPCSLLNQFAYDKEQGDQGKRIIQCQDWCKGN